MCIVGLIINLQIVCTSILDGALVVMALQCKPTLYKKAKFEEIVVEQNKMKYVLHESSFSQ